MTTLSISKREAFNAESTDEIPVVLVEITPHGATAPVCLCSEPIERAFDGDGELIFGITHQGQFYPWVLMSTRLPDDQEGQAPALQLVFANVVEDMAAQVRGVTPGTQAEVVIKLVGSSSPDFVEEFYRMTAVNGSYDALQVTLDVSREPIDTEPYPARRMTRRYRPALFR